MDFKVKSSSLGNHLVFSGPMTCRNSRDIENRIINAMRQHPQLTVDLSGVEEIDLCGIHLLGVLQSFGGEAVRIIATSPSVDAALLQLPSTHRHARLKRNIHQPIPSSAQIAQAAPLV